MVSSKTLLVVLVSVALVGSVLTFGAAGQLADDPDPQDESHLRAVHAAPDAPAVDVTVDDQTVLSDISFGDVSDYFMLDAGTYNVTIVAADDSDTVVFDAPVTVEQGTVTTLVASGELDNESAATAFAPERYHDDALAPGENDSAVRIVHLSPDAPAVDVTTEDGSVVLADNISFRETSEYVTVPDGNYTAEIRAETDANNGSLVAAVGVSLDNATAHSAMAMGYLEAGDAPADTGFQVIQTEDAMKTVHVPMANATAEAEGEATPT